MKRLVIGTIDSGRNGMKTMMIDGFTDAELKELKRMDNDAGMERLLEILDERNDGLGTQWKCGNGIYSFWCDNECAFLNIGDSCD